MNTTTATKRILIVDDEPNVRLVFRTALASPGAVLATAEDGETALSLIEATPFDLILLDLQMPGLGGMEVLEQLRARGNNVPVVMITAHGKIPDVVRAMQLGAIDFVAKPLTPDTLRCRVAEVLERHARRARERVRPTPRGKSGPVTVDSQFALQLSRAKRARSTKSRRSTKPRSSSSRRSPSRRIRPRRTTSWVCSTKVETCTARAIALSVSHAFKGRQELRGRPPQHDPLLRAFHVRTQRPRARHWARLRRRTKKPTEDP